MTSDRIEIWDADTKDSIWSTSNTLIDVGEDDALVLADLDNDGNLDIITRATSFSANNRVLVYNVNGVVPDDGNGDGNGNGNGDGQEDDSDTPFPGFVVIVFTVTVLAVIIARKR
jgi:hypothetical protein